jgi:D-threo-aldose 1-dehydrogenase
MRGPGGSRRCTGPATPWPPPHPAPGTRARPGLLARAEPPDDARFNYAPAAPELIARARALAGICARHGVELPAAAVQFPLRHPAVASVVSGMRTGQQVDSTLARFTTVVPDEAWLELDGR